MTQERELKVKEVIQRTHNVKSIRLEFNAPDDYKAGQFLQAVLNNDPQLKHYLSFSSSPTEKGFIEFTKKISQSNFSKALDSLKPGDSVKVQYPFGKFTLEDNGSPEKIAFLSGGIGITPIRSIAKFAVDKNLGEDIVLVYANRSVKDIAFKEDFDAMQKSYPKLRVAHVLCEAEPGFKCRVGMINSQVVRNEVPDFKERKFFLCGPPPMVEAMKKILVEELALPKEQVVTESFQGY
ncbi:MAG: oxidoreductase [Candidatus Omnitrophica bacterium]|nr:oxidoreductase [Candidatus Omnitrophota bacterium]MBU1869311.1 oxidoreductase [Candidatus Omnitrophota bacterium]